MKLKFLTGILLFVAIFSISASDSFAQATNLNQVILPITECNDGIDNDGDGLVDFASDPDCAAWVDDSESPEVSPPVATSSSSSSTGFLVSSESELVTEEEVLLAQDRIRTLLRSGSITQPNLFLWGPLGEVLGIQDEVARISAGLSQNPVGTIILCCYSLFIILLFGWILGYTYVKSKENEKQNEN